MRAVSEYFIKNYDIHARVNFITPFSAEYNVVLALFYPILCGRSIIHTTFRRESLHYLLTTNKPCGKSASGCEADLYLVARLYCKFAANVMLRVYIRVGSILERLDFPLARA